MAPYWLSLLALIIIIIDVNVKAGVMPEEFGSGDVESSPGDVESSPGDVESSPGNVGSSLGDVDISLINTTEHSTSLETSTQAISSSIIAETDYSTPVEGVTEYKSTSEMVEESTSTVAKTTLIEFSSSTGLDESSSTFDVVPITDERSQSTGMYEVTSVTTHHQSTTFEIHSTLLTRSEASQTTTSFRTEPTDQINESTTEMSSATNTNLLSTYTSTEVIAQTTNGELNETSANPEAEIPDDSNSTGRRDYTLLYLAYILPSAFVIALAIVISVACVCRHNRRKEQTKKKEQDGGYVLKRQRSFSNPAFMEQNINALAHQLNSRDSMIPSPARTKLKDYRNSFEEIDLSEEDLTKNSAGEKNNIQPQGGSFKRNLKNSPRLLRTEAISSKSAIGTIPENTPPLPNKGQKVTKERKEESGSHYDKLPLRESLPIKQRISSAQNESKQVQGLSLIHSEYDVLPLRTFSEKHKVEPNIQIAESQFTSMKTVSETNSKNTSEEKLTDEYLCSKTDSSDDSNNEDETFCGQVDDRVIKKLRERDPASRAPSFVVLPRAASGSLRTAL